MSRNVEKAALLMHSMQLVLELDGMLCGQAQNSQQNNKSPSLHLTCLDHQILDC